MFCRAIPYEGKEPYIFVSYCHRDWQQLYPLFEQMAKDGYRIWYDDGNHAGDDWMGNIDDHLENAGAMLAFISENSSMSHNCKSEIVSALGSGKKVIPILTEITALPRGLRSQISCLHYLRSVDFSSDRALLAKIYELEDIKACYAGGAQPMKSLTAPEPEKKPEPAADTGKKTAGNILAGLSAYKPAVAGETAEAAEPAEEKKAGIKVKRIKKLIGIKKQEKQEPASAVEPESAVKPTPEPAPVVESKPVVQPDPVPAPVKEPAPEPDPNESTVVTPKQATDPDEEKTIYDPKPRPAAEEDDDATVRAPRITESLLIQPSTGKVYRFSSPRVTLGRKTAQINIEGNDSISRKHAVIIQNRGTCFLSDDNSSFGTFLNGQQLEPKAQVKLDNPAVFQLHDETLVFASGILARKLIDAGKVEFLLNGKQTAVRILDEKTLPFPLNRYNKWPDGTLGDRHVHREQHAVILRREDGLHLLDESPEEGNGTFLNGNRMRHGQTRLLTSEDRIGVGEETVLTYYAVEITKPE